MPIDLTAVEWEQLGIVTFLVFAVGLLIYTIRAFVRAAWYVYQDVVREKNEAIKLAQELTDRFGEALALIKEMKS